MTGAGRWTTTRRRHLIVALSAVVVALVIAIVVSVAVLNHRSSVSVAPGTSARPTTPGPAGDQVLAVKVDNVAAARPQTGIAAASVVYVEPVEGGLTRLMAVFTGTPPPAIGPVRSARHTDLGLLAQYGRPVFAYSGAAPPVLADVRSARLVDASPAAAPVAYQRSTARTAPHNLYLRPSRLPGGAIAPALAPFEFGGTAATSTPVEHYRVTYAAASFALTWSPAAGRWLISMDGTAVVDAAAGRVTAATVVLQRVEVTTDESILPAEGRARSPVARTVGTGSAVVLRDGHAIAATWSRPAASAPTRFTAAGVPVPMAAGPVWVFLLPR